MIFGIHILLYATFFRNYTVVLPEFNK